MSTAEELAEKDTDMLQNVVIARAEAANMEDFTVDVPKCSSWRVGRVQWDEEVEHIGFLYSVVTRVFLLSIQIDMS